MEITAGDTQELVLEPAWLSELQGRGYCIGPYGNKVGFAFQQKRALNVTLAAKLSEMLKPGARVAVLGGGLAGTTAGIALTGMGHMAEIFELRDRVLKLQLPALHRILHPCYNSWPMVNRFASSTNHPFLNWYVDTAKRVTDALYEEWKACFEPELPEPNTRCLIKKVDLCGANSDSVLVQFQETQEDPDKTVVEKEERFDAVFVALGFGEEVDLSLSDEATYWVPDSISKYRNDETNTEFVVSGTGDGGLIDCLRFMHSKIEDGKLLIEVISTLRHNRYAKPPREIEDLENYDISQIESRIRKLEKDIEQKNRADDPDIGKPNYEFGTPMQNEISRELAAGYMEIAAALPKKCKDLLNASLYKPERVTLHGRFETPFSPNAAPINKLLIAHALTVHPGLYVQGLVEEYRGAPYLKRPGVRRKRITVDRKVVRHGTKAPIRELFPSFDVEKARKTHTLQNVIDVKLQPAAFSSALPNVVRDRPDDEEFIRARRAKAESFAIKVLSTTLTADWDKKESTGLFVIDPNDAYNESAKKTGGFDRELFGLPVVAKAAGKYQSGVKGTA